jgi:hypothetical protein
MTFLLQMALEEYIKQVKETWTNYTLDLVNYQNKCRLIRFVSRFCCMSGF